MTTIVDSTVVVIGGVDTHRDTHTAAAVNQVGAVLGTETFPATRTGYRRLLGWLGSFGPVGSVGVEGTGSYGAGLARALASAGVEVREVIRPNRQARRRHGKSDPADAVAAARAVLSGEANGYPKGSDGPVESIRMLKIARNSAVKHRTQVANQIRAIVTTATPDLRSSLEGKTLTQIVNTAVAYRPTDPIDPYQAAKLTLRTLSRRWKTLGEEIDALDTHLRTLVTATAPPSLLAEVGIGIQNAADLLVAAGDNPDRIGTEAAFAALCGVSPVDASSGLQQRHRLNRGGNRQANAALHRAIIVRLRYHEPTHKYMTRRLTEGKTRKEIMRCLKRALARNIHHHLANPPNPI